MAIVGITLDRKNPAFTADDFTFWMPQFTNYIATKEPMDKAGAYGIQEKGSLFVKGIQGDFFNGVGLSVALLDKVLTEEFDIGLI